MKGKINIEHSAAAVVKIANTVSAVTIFGNILLFIFKLFAGIAANSTAMTGDAIHSASDIFSTVVVILGIKLASKESDREHPYGHERIECVAAVILAMVLFVTGLAIGADAINRLFSASDGESAVPGMLALVAAAVSIAVKEAMFWYTKFNAEKIGSDALMADAWHHRSDAFSSIGALIGIAGARMGFPALDPLAGLVIFVFIAKAAYDIFMTAADKLIDRSSGEETERKIRECIMKNDEVLGIDMLRTRIFGNKIYVDIEILADGSYTLNHAHEIAEAVHDDIENSFPEIKHIMVHVNPAQKN